MTELQPTDLSETVEDMVPLKELPPLSRDDWERFIVTSYKLSTNLLTREQLSDDDLLLQYRIRRDAPQLKFGANPMTMGLLSGMLRKMTTKPEHQEAYWRMIGWLQYDLGYHTAPQLERLHIEHVLVCWLQLSWLQTLHVSAMTRAPVSDRSKHLEQRLTPAQNRYLKAMEALARIRRLTKRMPVQINIGGQQVNIAGNIELPTR